MNFDVLKIEDPPKEKQILRSKMSSRKNLSNCIYAQIIENWSHFPFQSVFNPTLQGLFDDKTRRTGGWP